MFDAALLKSALDRWCAALEAAAPELNALDGRLGDGDLGATLQKCAANVRAAAAALPDDLAGIFKRCAGACANASGSSFGTLLAVAFLTASKAAGGAERMDRRATVQALDQAVAALSARGGAARGDKTMLDSLHAIARALDESPDGVALRPVAVHAARAALDEFRSRPNRIGRARMFADKSVGLDDPGMVAILRMVQAL